VSYGRQTGYEQQDGAYDSYGSHASFGAFPPYTVHVAHTAYASWGARLGGAVIDVLIGAPGYVLGYFLADATGSPTTVDPATFAVHGGPNYDFLFVGFLVTLVIWCLNLLRQGITGSSVGQRVFGIRIVHWQSGRPIGFRLAVGHYLAHVLDFPLLLGFLWPLWDRERQTFADKTCGVVVLTIRHPGFHAR
jgi:uncharacterized RDD family membrane protein YckC